MKLAVVVSQRLCRVKECSQLIRWHAPANGFGYWVNVDGDHKDQKHLCPFWKDKRKPPETEKTQEIMLQKITRIEAAVEEIRMKLDNMTFVDMRQ
jgi:hypothetical protein